MLEVGEGQSIEERALREPTQSTSVDVPLMWRASDASPLPPSSACPQCAPDGPPQLKCTACQPHGYLRHCGEANPDGVHKNNGCSTVPPLTQSIIQPSQQSFNSPLVSSSFSHQRNNREIPCGPQYFLKSELARRQRVVVQRSEQHPVVTTGRRAKFSSVDRAQVPMILTILGRSV